MGKPPRHPACAGPGPAEEEAGSHRLAMAQARRNRVLIHVQVLG